MRQRFVLLALLGLLAAPGFASAASGRVIKVLPHFLDRQGRHTLSPSLYERDAYQAYLREHPEERAGLRLDVQWKARDARDLKLRAELRGGGKGQPQVVLEQSVRPRRWFSTWSAFTLDGPAYQQLGELVAWRVTLWAGDQLLGEQRSFLW